MKSDIRSPVQSQSTTSPGFLTLKAIWKVCKKHYQWLRYSTGQCARSDAEYLPQSDTCWPRQRLEGQTRTILVGGYWRQRQSVLWMHSTVRWRHLWQKPIGERNSDAERVSDHQLSKSKYKNKMFFQKLDFTNFCVQVKYRRKFGS